jgi:tetratricopeptide (TPR) repeat protein
MKNAESRMQKTAVRNTQHTPEPDRKSQIANRKSSPPAWLLAVVLVLVTIALYWPAMRCGFVNYDDNLYVTANVPVQNGLTWESLKWAWFNPVDCNWHPLTVWSHMMDCQLFGLKPWGHHLTSVLLHALNAGLVFALLQRLTGVKWRSLLVATLFAVHPLRVESVAWVSERKDVLCAFFGLLALVAYARYATRGQRSEPRGPWSVVRGSWSFSRLPASIFYLLSLCLFACGLMSKAMLVTWPFVMLLLDYWPLGRMQNAECRMQNVEAGDTQHPPRTSLQSQIGNPKAQILLPLLFEKLPFFFLAAAVSVVTFLVQQRGGAVIAAESLPLGARLANALISYGRYLGKLFWPTDLAVYYSRPGQWPTGKVLLAGGLILGLSVLVWVRRRLHPYSLMGWLWFLGTLVPVIGLVQVGGQVMADRYTYLPSLGVVILSVWGAYELARSWRYQERALVVAGGAAIVLCLALTRQQLGHWKDGETLFRHALEVTKSNHGAHSGLGIALYMKGQTDEAIAEYTEALRLNPDDPVGHNILGIALDKKGQLDEAIRQFQEALRLNPNRPDFCYNLAIAFFKQGRTNEAMGQFEAAVRLLPYLAEVPDLGAELGLKGSAAEVARQFQKALKLKHYDALAPKNTVAPLDQKDQTTVAISQFQEAVRLRPDSAAAHYNLGLALGQKDQVDEAIRQFRETLRLESDHPLAHYSLGNALLLRGHIDEAIRQFQEAIRIKPDHAEAHYNLGVALGSKGQIDEAITQYQEATRLEPGNADACYNLGLALASKGETEEAIHRFEAALNVKPNYSEAHNHLGLALVRKGQTAEAIRQFQEALRLKPDYADARRNLEAVRATQGDSSPPPGPATNR